MTEEDRELLIRLDERIKNIEDKLDEIQKLIDKNRDEVKEETVTQKEFGPVRNAVYAAIGTIVTAFLGLLASLIGGLPK